MTGVLGVESFFGLDNQSVSVRPALACEPENPAGSPQKHCGLQREQNDGGELVIDRPDYKRVPSPGLRLQRDFAGDHLRLLLSLAKFHNNIGVPAARIRIAGSSAP